jgi:hypothetical protein
MDNHWWVNHKLAVVLANSARQMERDRAYGEAVWLYHHAALFERSAYRDLRDKAASETGGMIAVCLVEFLRKSNQPEAAMKWVTEVLSGEVHASYRPELEAYVETPAQPE